MFRVMGGVPSSEQCSVCSHSIKGKTLSCGHIFHVSCIDEWLNDKGNCPVCRRPFNNAAISTLTETNECSICLDNISPPKTLPCNHEFHISCIYNKTNCPQCNAIFEEIQPIVCVFCSEVLHTEEKKLNCGHSFHETCISPWLIQYNSCPECSSQVDPNKLFMPPYNCSICIKKVIVKERILPCGHRFHETCVAEYVKDCNACPACFKPVDPTKPAPGLEPCSICSEIIGGPGTVLICGHKSHLSCYKTLPMGQESCQECLAYNASLEEANIRSLCLFCSERLGSEELALPCGHHFHAKCAAPWLREEKICPECLVSLSDINTPLPEVVAASIPPSTSVSSANTPSITPASTSNSPSIISVSSSNIPSVTPSSTGNNPSITSASTCKTSSITGVCTSNTITAGSCPERNKDPETSTNHPRPIVLNNINQYNRFSQGQNTSLSSPPFSHPNPIIPIPGNAHSVFPSTTHGTSGPFQTKHYQSPSSFLHYPQYQPNSSVPGASRPINSRAATTACIQESNPNLHNLGNQPNFLPLYGRNQTHANWRPTYPPQSYLGQPIRQMSETNQNQQSFTRTHSSNSTEPISQISKPNLNISSSRVLRTDYHNSDVNRVQSIPLTIRQNAQMNTERSLNNKALTTKPNSSVQAPIAGNSETSGSRPNPKTEPRRSSSLERAEGSENSRHIPKRVFSSTNRRIRKNSEHEDTYVRHRYTDSNENTKPRDYQRNSPLVKTNLTRQKSNSKSLSSLHLSSLKLRPMEDIQETKCDLCQNIIASNSVRISCGHIFHQPCLVPWIKNEKVCPKCQESILEIYRNETRSLQTTKNEMNHSIKHEEHTPQTSDSEDSTQSTSSEDSGTESETDDDKEQLKFQIAQLKLKDKLRERRLVQIEEESRKKNLIFRGFKDLDRDSYSDTVAYFCSEVLGIDMSDKIEKVYAIGRRDLRNPQLKVVFSTVQDTYDVLKRCKRLKGTDFCVMRDYPKEVKIRRNKLLHCRYIILDKTNLKKVSVRDDVLWVESRKFIWDDEEGLVGLDPSNEAFLKNLVGNKVWMHLKTFDS